LDAGGDLAARGGELDGVAEQVREHLVQSLAVTHDAAVGRQLVRVVLPVEAGALHQRTKTLHDGVHQAGDVDGLSLELDGRALEARHLEKVVDHDHERLNATLDLVDVGDQRRGKRAVPAVQHQIRAQRHGVER
jgi:hypothetical protein